MPSAESAARAFDQLIAGRHSCRAFASTVVPRDTITRILQAAQATASWSNVQPWHVIVTEGEATDRFRSALIAHAASATAKPDLPFPREYPGVYADRRRHCAMQLYASVGITTREAAANHVADNYRLFGAPHVAIVSTPEALGVYGAVDCGAYVNSFLLAAASLGVATLAQAALASHSAFVRSHFGIPDGRLVVCGIAFGYADASHPANRLRVGRAPLGDAVAWHEH